MEYLISLCYSLVNISDWTIMFCFLLICFCCQFIRFGIYTRTHTHIQQRKEVKCRRVLFQPLLTTDLRELNPNTHSLPSINSHLAVCAWIMAASSPIESCWSGCFWPGLHVCGVCWFWNHWPSANLEMVCVRAWMLLGRFHGSCLTWSRSFLVQLSFGSISWWNSVQKQSQDHWSQTCRIKQTTTLNWRIHIYAAHKTLWSGISRVECCKNIWYIAPYTNALTVDDSGHKSCQRLLPWRW